MTKIQAAWMATSSGVTVVIANGHVPEVVTRLVRGEELGTLFTPVASKTDSRRRWILSGIGSKGRLIVDKGATRALTQDHRSLLSAGVQEIQGEFGRGDLVEIYDDEGIRIGIGLTNYGSLELSKLKGARSTEIQRLLGYKYGDEVVHRNDLVLFEGEVRCSNLTPDS